MHVTWYALLDCGYESHGLVVTHRSTLDKAMRIAYSSLRSYIVRCPFSALRVRKCVHAELGVSSGKLVRIEQRKQWRAHSSRSPNERHCRVRTHMPTRTHTMVDASSLNHLLQKRASAAAASGQHAHCAPVHSELSCQPSQSQHKCSSARPAAAAAVAPFTIVTTAAATQTVSRPPSPPSREPASTSATDATGSKSLLLSPSEEIAAHRAKYARFFTMLRIGIPRETVEQAMRLAGVDPVELDGPHLVVEKTTAVASSGVGTGAGAAATSAAAVGGDSQLHTAAAVVRKNVLRKRLYWDAKVRSATGSSSSSSHVEQERMWSPRLMLRTAHPDSSGSSSPSPATETLAWPSVSRETEALLEKLFVKDALAPVLSSCSGSGAAFAREIRITILETKKAQNIGITLARVKLSLPDLVRELVSLNPTVLCAAQLRSLLDMWPDRKELDAIDAFSGNTALLDKVRSALSRLQYLQRQWRCEQDVHTSHSHLRL